MLDTIHDLIDELIAKHEGQESANEAEVRFKIIDEVLKGLEWIKDDIEVEPHTENGYSDYILSVEGSSRMVIEAKRAGKAFYLKESDLEDRPYTFGFIAEEFPEAHKALLQATNYALTCGAEYTAISNGHQWLVSLSLVPGKKITEKNVLVFTSLRDIQRRKRTFIKAFGKPSVRLHEAKGVLLDLGFEPPPPKLSARVSGYPNTDERNRYRNELSFVLNYVWRLMESSESSKSFVTNCYVVPHDHRQTIELVRELLTKRINEDGILSAEEVKSAGTLSDSIRLGLSERPFVILGNVGSGKTSFLRYVRYQAAADLLSGYYQIEINFLDRPDKSAEIPGFIYSEIERQLLANYEVDVLENSFVRGVLNLEIKRFRKSPSGKATKNEGRLKEAEVSSIEQQLVDKHSYFEKVFRHLKKGRNISIAIFMDNLDRRPEDFQEEAFLKSSAMARDWAAMVFICLRPLTFHNSRESGNLDVIAPTVFTVSPPDLSVVLKRRFTYAKTITDGKRAVNQVKNALTGTVSAKLPNVSLLLGCCEFSARNSTGVIPVLTDASNGNIRRLLDFARQVLTTGHLDTQKIVDIIKSGKKYTIPSFEGIKSLMLGEYKEYDPNTSPFINLFDVQQAERREHFLAISALLFLEKSNPGDGVRPFRKRSALLNHLAGVGYFSRSTAIVIDRLERKHLLTRGVRTNEPTEYRLSDLGALHLRTLASNFQYFQAMVVDTPIMAEKLRKELRFETKIQGRISQAELSLGYLTSCLAELSDKELFSYWQETSRRLRAQFSSIQRRVR